MLREVYAKYPNTPVAGVASFKGCTCAVAVPPGWEPLVVDLYRLSSAEIYHRYALDPSLVVSPVQGGEEYDLAVRGTFWRLPYPPVILWTPSRAKVDVLTAFDTLHDYCVILDAPTEASVVVLAHRLAEYYHSEVFH